MKTRSGNRKRSGEKLSASPCADLIPLTAAAYGVAQTRAEDTGGNERRKRSPCHKLSGPETAELKHTGVIEIHDGFGSTYAVFQVGACPADDITFTADPDRGIPFQRMQDICHVCSKTVTVAFPFKERKTHAVMCAEGKR